jgi:hypothetical protein
MQHLIISRSRPTVKQARGDMPTVVVSDNRAVGRLTSIACALAYVPWSNGETQFPGGHRMSAQESAATGADVAAPAEAPQHTPIIDARLADLTARFGERFSDEQRAQVRSRIARTVALAATLRKTPLTNADEPEIVFVPYRAEGRS